MNHVHKETKYIVSVIITVGKDTSGGNNVFYDGVKTSNLGSIAHIWKHLYGRMILSPFEFFFHESTRCSGYRAAVYFILTK